jgi:hypothetical protein
MQSSPQKSKVNPSFAGDWSPTNLTLLFLLTVFAFLIMGYHPGLEDDAFYLAAIKRDLNPALFPHDAEFFTVQFQATIFDKLIALSVRLTHLPLIWDILLWQLAGIFFILHGCWRIARRCFTESSAQWAAVTLIAALLTLPIAGTAINLADQYLHPRTLATAAILAAVVVILDRRLWLAGLLLAIAFSIHAIMASFGISFCAILYFVVHRSPRKRVSTFPLVATFLFPLGWLFAPTSDAWRQAASTRGFYYISHWQWYEWLGVFAPLALLYAYRFWVAQRFQRRDEEDKKNGALAPEGTPQSFVSALLYYGIFQTIIGIAVMLPQSLERLRPLEPMRYLHLLYLLFFLLIGGLLGRHVLNHHAYRWLLLFVPLSAGMFYAQRQLYPAIAHIEWPGLTSNEGVPRNPWLEAFSWIRDNTPVDAVFALDPHYMHLPAEDYHGFRALAERSVLADYDKDGGMAARVPGLAPRWLKEVTAEKDWRNFQPQDFQRLKNNFGVNWIVLSREDAMYSRSENQPGITCLFANSQLRICRLY